MRVQEPRHKYPEAVSRNGSVSQCVWIRCNHSESALASWSSVLLGLASCRIKVTDVSV